MNKVLDHVYRALMALSFIDGDKLRVELENAVKELEKENANSGYPLLADGSKFNIKELLTEYTQYLYDCNYLDDDWWCEDPGSVEAFLKEKFGNVS